MLGVSVFIFESLLSGSIVNIKGMKMIEAKVFKKDELESLLLFVNSEKINIISITQAKNNDYTLFYNPYNIEQVLKKAIDLGTENKREFHD